MTSGIEIEFFENLKQPLADCGSGGKYQSLAIKLTYSQGNESGSGVSDQKHA